MAMSEAMASLRLCLLCRPLLTATLTQLSSFVTLVLLGAADCADCLIRSCWCVLAFALALFEVAAASVY